MRSSIIPAWRRGGLTCQWNFHHEQISWKFAFTNSAAAAAAELTASRWQHLSIWAVCDSCFDEMIENSQLIDTTAQKWRAICRKLLGKNEPFVILRCRFAALFGNFFRCHRNATVWSHPRSAEAWHALSKGTSQFYLHKLYATLFWEQWKIGTWMKLVEKWCTQSRFLDSLRHKLTFSLCCSTPPGRRYPGHHSNNGWTTRRTCRYIGHRRACGRFNETQGRSVDRACEKQISLHLLNSRSSSSSAVICRLTQDRYQVCCGVSVNTGRVCYWSRVPTGTGFRVSVANRAPSRTELTIRCCR